MVPIFDTTKVRISRNIEFSGSIEACDTANHFAGLIYRKICAMEIVSQEIDGLLRKN